MKTTDEISKEGFGMVGGGSGDILPNGDGISDELPYDPTDV